VYVSEGLRPSVTSLLKSIASSQSSHLVHSFEDKTYNRTSYYFLGGNLQESVLALADTAFKSIDFTQHQGTHPTLGTVDHISFVPLENSTISDATLVAKSFCQSFIDSFQVPIYSYGELSSTKKKLKNLRKELGYFDQSQIQSSVPSVSSVPVPDYVTSSSPSSIHQNIRHGLTCVGVVPFVLNFNIRFRSIDPRSKVTQITQHLRSSNVRKKKTN